MGQDGMGWDRTSGTPCLRCHIYACIHWWTMWTNCPRPAPIATNWPIQDRTGRDGTGRDRTGWDKWDTLPEMPYIYMYTLMDHVDQLSPASTNSHKLTPTGGGGVMYGTGWDKVGHLRRVGIYTEKFFFGTTTKCSSLKGLRTKIDRCTPCLWTSATRFVACTPRRTWCAPRHKLGDWLLRSEWITRRALDQC